MAEYELRAGAKIELLTPSEMADMFSDLKDALSQGTPVPTVTHTPPLTFTTDASGNVGGGASGSAPLIVYECPVGFQAMVHRIVVDAPTATPATPLAAGWMRFTRNAATVATTEYFLPASGTTIAPTEVDWGSNSAPMLMSGETLVVWGASLGNAVQYVVHCQVRLFAATTGRVT